MRFSPGDFIEWEYYRYPQKGTPVCKKKQGVFLGYVKHTTRYNGAQLGVVQFKNNKTARRIEVRKLTKGEQDV